jgi:hypothetical protein
MLAYMKQESYVMGECNWNALATQTFCKICAQERLDGNRPTAFLSNTGRNTLR